MWIMHVSPKTPFRGVLWHALQRLISPTAVTEQSLRMVFKRRPWTDEVRRATQVCTTSDGLWPVACGTTNSRNQKIQAIW